MTSKELVSVLDNMKEDERFINFQEKIINTKLKIIGVKIPSLRKFAKECYKNKIQINFNKETDKYFECVVLEGLLISLENSKEDVKIKLCKYFEKMDNWAVVDMVCASLKCFKKQQTIDDFRYFENLTKSKNSFTVRFGIIGLLKFFSDEKYIDELFSVLNNIKCGDYYVDMAIAWLVSEIIIKNVQNAEKIMKKAKLINNFNSFIVNKSVDKVCDSFRVKSEIKQKLKGLKIK